MIKSLVATLPPKVKVWFAHAAVGVITADGVVTENELEHLRETISFLDNLETINEVIAMVKKKVKPTLQSLRTDSKTASKILMHLANIAITDDRLSDSEIEFFHYVGKKLGFDPSFTDEVIRLEKDCINLNKRRKSLLKRAHSYQTL